ncbi:Intersectin-1 [Exaiptasia diaphana]|nr:Intersectin-1 [Exaiptasia diaphana]
MKQWNKMLDDPSSPVQPVETSPTYDTPPTEPVQPKQEDLPILFEIATVITPYTATTPDQLSLAPGQLIKVMKKDPSGWWDGELQARGKKRQSGIFPSNHVKLLSKSPNVTPTSSGRTTPQPADLSSVKIATVITPYTATTPDQLSLAPGQLIKVMKKDPSGWWDGELQARGKKRQSGIFPSNHVKLLSKSPNVTPTSSGRTTPQPADLSSTYDVLPVSKTMGQAKLEQVLAMFPYTAQNQDELTFYKGSVINVISREGDWWKGEMNGQVGMFPSNYVQALSDLPVTTTQCK